MPISVDECRKYMLEMFGISLNSCEKIGHGAQGSVFKVRYDDHDNAVLRAVKIGGFFDAEFELIKREINALEHFTRISNDSFPRLYGYKIKDNKYIIIEEYCDSIDVVFKKNLNNTIDENYILEVQKLGLDILSALGQLSIIERIHRDVKKDNMLCKKIVDDNNNITYKYLLCDLGLISSRLTETGGTTVPGATPEYAPKEVYTVNNYSQKDWDTFGLGVKMYELLTGKHPYIDNIINNNVKIDDRKKIYKDDDLLKLPGMEKYKYVAYTILKSISDKPEERYNNYEDMQKNLLNNGKDVEKDLVLDQDDNDKHTKLYDYKFNNEKTRKISTTDIEEKEIKDGNIKDSLSGKSIDDSYNNDKNGNETSHRELGDDNSTALIPRKEKRKHKHRLKLKKIVTYAAVVLIFLSIIVLLENKYGVIIGGVNSFFESYYGNNIEQNSSIGEEKQKETDEASATENSDNQNELKDTSSDNENDYYENGSAENSNINEDDLLYDEVGKEVEFGVYTTDYSSVPIKRDYIKWIILGKEGDNVLLVSKDVIFVEPYNEIFDQVGWEDSTLNKQLQTSIFSKNEYEKIVSTNYGENGDDNRVFILDGKQVKTYLNEDNIIANAPDYLLKTDVMHDGTACAYWVRDDDIEFSGFTKPIVTPDGTYSDDYSGNIFDVNREDIGVRPAIYLKEDFVEELLQSEVYWQIDPLSNYNIFLKNDDYTLLTNDFLSTTTLPVFSGDRIYVFLYSDSSHTNDINSYSTIYHYAVFKKND